LENFSEDLTAEEEVFERKQTRVNYLAALQITTEDAKVLLGNLRDINEECLFAKIDEPEGEPVFLPKVGTLVDVVMTINRGNSRLTIGTPGKVVRKDQGGIAIEFSEPLKWWPIFTMIPQDEDFLLDIVSGP
jgi:sporulation protein YlmC with PRC-barrel domain